MARFQHTPLRDLCRCLPSYRVMNRRMTLIVLALVGSMVLIVTIAPPDSGVRKPGKPAPAPSPRTEQLSNPDAFDVTATVSAAPGERASTVEAEVGDRVEITVDGNEPDGVAVGDLAMDALEPGDPAHFELLADTPGNYPLILVNQDRRIGTLTIR